jgi:hypothetical protein
MARPKLPIAQLKSLVMTVRMRLDLNDGLAAVAHLRGTTKSGLVSQYAAEQIRLEHERDRAPFDAAVKEIRVQREARLRKKSAQSRLERRSGAPDCLKASSEQRPLVRPWCLESRPHDRLIERLYDSGKRVIHANRGSLPLLARGKRTARGDSIANSGGINLVPEHRE